MAAFFSSNRGKPIKLALCILGLLLNMPASNENKNIAIDDNKRYYKTLSKLVSGQPFRLSLAFFVSNICLASQAKHIVSTAPYYLSQGKSVYDGVTSQNTIALGRICGAVANKTESEPRHLIRPVFNTGYNVALTHNLLGGSYHG